MPNSKRFQITYRVNFDAPIFKGDCGSWVLDAETQGLYGHLIAGCERSTVAWIIPSMDVVEDAQKRLGSHLQLYCHPLMQTKPPILNGVTRTIESEVSESSLSRVPGHIRAADTFECRSSLAALFLDNTTALESRGAARSRWQPNYSHQRAVGKTWGTIPDRNYQEGPLEDDFISWRLRLDSGSDISPEADAIETFGRGGKLSALQERRRDDMALIALFDQRKFEGIDSSDNSILAPLTAWGLYQALNGCVSMLTNI